MLELPSISQVRNQTVDCVPWYSDSERLPAIAAYQQPCRGISHDSSSASASASTASTGYTEYSHDLKGSPSSVDGAGVGAAPDYTLGSMNQAPYMDVHSSHQPYTTQPGPVESVPHYAHYQPPLLHHAHPHAHAHASYGHGSSYQPYGYPGVSSATSQPMPNTLAPPMQQSLVPLHPPRKSLLLPLKTSADSPAMTTAAASAHSYPATSYPDQQQDRQAPMDTTGQVAPPDTRPKVSATLWEDEGTLCYQIEAGGICVARRDGNYTLLNCCSDAYCLQTTTWSTAPSCSTWLA